MEILGPRPYPHKQNLLDYLEELKERAVEEEKKENEEEKEKESGSDDDEGEPEIVKAEAEKS